MAKNIAIYLLTVSLFVVTFAVNLQAPLYSHYAAGSQFGATAVTIAFAAYVFGLLPCVMIFGGLSDRIGRRIPIFLALILGMLATLIVVWAPSLGALIIARFVLGVATALATTAGSAYMAEIMGENRARTAALFVTSATSLGFGGGALATGVSLSIEGVRAMPMSYLFLILAAPILAMLVLKLPKDDRPSKVSIMRRPIFPKGTWIYGVAMTLAWSTTGMTIAIVPLQLEQHGLGAWSGFVIFLAIFIGFCCQPIAKRLANPTALLVGFALIPLGFCMVLFGAFVQSIIWVLLGTAVTSSASYGFSYLAALSEFSIQAPENRARSTAGLLVYAYFGFSIPVILSGVFADRFGIFTSMGIFTSVLVLVTICVVGVWKRSTIL